MKRKHTGTLVVVPERKTVYVCNPFEGICHSTDLFSIPKIPPFQDIIPYENEELCRQHCKRLPQDLIQEIELYLQKPVFGLSKELQKQMRGLTPLKKNLLTTHYPEEEKESERIYQEGLVNFLKILQMPWPKLIQNGPDAYLLRWEFDPTIQKKKLDFSKWINNIYLSNIQKDPSSPERISSEEWNRFLKGIRNHVYRGKYVATIREILRSSILTDDLPMARVLLPILRRDLFDEEEFKEGEYVNAAVVPPEVEVSSVIPFVACAFFSVSKLGNPTRILICIR